MGINRIFLADGQYVFNGFIDEDKRDQGGEVFLCETCDVAHESTSVDRYENYQN